MMEKHWIQNELPHGPEVQKLAEDLKNMPLPLAGILVARGIDTFEKARKFFRPELDHLEDPMLMKDMDRAVDRVREAIDNGEKIMLLGDYDVDGTTATSIMFKFLERLNAKVEYYIPDRYLEGYGVSFQSIEYAREHSFKLIISLDCGIKAVDKVAKAKEYNIDFIICDHHTPGTILPPAVAVLDPKQDDCQYPFKELSGAGVGFKLCQALAENYHLPKEIVYQYLDFVATSIAADIVPIVDENRVMATFGLEKINRNPSHGIATIMELSGAKKAFTISDVVFKIAPRINAAGRMSSGRKAVDLLVSEDVVTTAAIGSDINGFNSDRRDADQSITLEALEMVQLDTGFINRKTTVLFHEGWHKGVIGIVASRMIEHYYRPTIIFGGENGKLSGSARSVRNFDIYQAIEQCEDLLEQFGGHKYAAGMTLKLENFEAFRQKFDEVVASLIQPDQLHPSIEVDAELNVTEIDDRFVRILKQFEPFGPGNMNPIFLSRQVMILEPRLVGQDHLKFIACSPENTRKTWSAIAFGLGSLIDEVAEGSLVDMVYTVEENIWQQRREIQLNVKDMRC